MTFNRFAKRVNFALGEASPLTSEMPLSKGEPCAYKAGVAASLICATDYGCLAVAPTALSFNQQRPAFAKMRVVPIRTVLLLSQAELDQRELSLLQRRLAARIRKRNYQRANRERTRERNRASYYRNRAKVLAAQRAYRERLGREEMKRRFAKYRSQ